MNSSIFQRMHTLPASPLPQPPKNGPAPPLLKADPDCNCPRCQTVLTDPHGIGLCSRCGYCRSLEVEGVAILSASRRRKRWLTELNGLRQALHAAPATCVVILVSLVAVVPQAWLADRQFLPGSRERAIWSAGHLLCGLLLLLAGQVWAVTQLKRINEQVKWGDLLSPFRLWGLTIRRLPMTGWPVGLGGSGMLAFLTAVFWIGGLSYWARIDTTADVVKARVPREVTAEQKFGFQREVEQLRVIRELERQKTQREERSAPEPGNSTAVRMVDSQNSPSSAETTSDPRPTEKCVIVGFVPASGGQAAGLILATLREGQLVFAGIVRKGVNQTPAFLDRLSKLGRSRPLIDGPKLNAVWVQPELFCEVHQSGAKDNGEFVDPHFKGLIED